MQVIFHFRAIKLKKDGFLDDDDFQESVLDDTRTLGSGPFELLIGRGFKMDVWEKLVQTMRIGEVARFRCPFKVHCSTPPF